MSYLAASCFNVYELDLNYSFCTESLKRFGGLCKKLVQIKIDGSRNNNTSIADVGVQTLITDCKLLKHFSFLSDGSTFGSLSFQALCGCSLLESIEVDSVIITFESVQLLTTHCQLLKSNTFDVIKLSDKVLQIISKSCFKLQHLILTGLLSDDGIEISTITDDGIHALAKSCP